MGDLERLSLPAPAKINLFLHITGRREDGYHLLQTVFQFLDYGDQLQFQLREDGLIKRTYDLPGVDPDDDLVIRAARLLQQQAKTPLGVEMGMHKILPMGGGLGGGSSDAATVLVALNKLWQLEWNETQLAALGLQLGADVPIFIHGHAAWAEGVGEQFQDINPDEPWYLVIIPPVSVSTAKIFCDPTLIRSAPAITIRDFLADATVDNMLQPVVMKHYPEVKEALMWLAQYSDNARMTGSGACIFAAFADEQQASKVLGELPGTWQGFVARGCNISPLMTAISSQSN